MNAERADRATLVWGLLFALTGLAFLGQEWGLWQVRADVLVPLLLIAAGGVLLFTDGRVGRPASRRGGRGG